MSSYLLGAGARIIFCQRKRTKKYEKSQFVFFVYFVSPLFVSIRAIRRLSSLPACVSYTVIDSVLPLK